MIRLVCFAVFLTAVTGQIVINGKCDSTLGHVTAPNLTAILGTWNQIARINDEVGECSSMTLTGQYDVNMQLTGILCNHLEVFNNTIANLTGSLEMEQDGTFKINVPGFFVGPFLVQAIDYTSYGILYSCKQLTVANEAGTVNDTKIVWAWQYNRKATLSSTEQAAVQNIVDANPDLKNAKWKYVSHTKAACGGAGMPLAISNVLIIFAILFISKEFI